jgi:hypothetical protein
MFGFLLLHQWACVGQRVVLQKRGFTYPILLCNEGAFKLKLDAFDRELSRNDVM